MRNRVKISSTSWDEMRRKEVCLLLERLPADILLVDGTAPEVVVDSVGEEHNYSIRVPAGHKVVTYGENCDFLQMNVFLGRNPSGNFAHGRDYIDFGDLQHPQKCSHRFWINPRLS